MVFFSSNISVFRYVLILSPFLFLAPATITAAEITSLRESVSYAVAHNRTLAVSVTHVDRAQAEVDMATGQIMPSVDVSTGFVRTNSPLGSFGAKLQQKRITAADFSPASLNQPGYINNYQSRVGVNMPLYSGGAMWAGRARAMHRAEASELEFEFHKQQVIYQTIAAYVHSRQAAAQVKASENAVKAAKKRLQDAEAMKKRGMAIDSDVMDAHVHVLRSQVRMDEARNMYAQSLESLRLILGMDSSAELNPLSEPNLRFSPEPVARMLEKQSDRRADLLALEGELEASESARNQSRSGYLPHVNLMAAQEWNSETPNLNNSNAMVGVVVNMNLFSGGEDSAKVRAATSDRVALEFQLQDKRHQIRNEISQAYRNVQMAEQRFQSESEASKQTSESLRIKSLRHAQGLETTSDLLDAQVRADASKMEYIRARYSLVTAKAALLLTTGMLDEEAVQ
ncbi:MAG: TolC family protein [Mariprofundaceae bacterium]|nr:TolC family protein [Mariprofundaceae bacterium]